MHGAVRLTLIVLAAAAVTACDRSDNKEDEYVDMRVPVSEGIATPTPGPTVPEPVASASGGASVGTSNEADQPTGTPGKRDKRIKVAS